MAKGRPVADLQVGGDPGHAAAGASEPRRQTLGLGACELARGV